MRFRMCCTAAAAFFSLVGCTTSPAIPVDPSGKPPGCSVADLGESFGAIDAPPEPIHMAPADYPDLASPAEAVGSVELLVTIGTKGYVCDVEMVSSSAVPSLEQASIEAAWKWRFKPATRDGVAVATRIKVPFRFSVNDE